MKLNEVLLESILDVINREQKDVMPWKSKAQAMEEVKKLIKGLQQFPHHSAYVEKLTQVYSAALAMMQDGHEPEVAWSYITKNIGKAMHDATPSTRGIGFTNDEDREKLLDDILEHARPTLKAQHVNVEKTAHNKAVAFLNSKHTQYDEEESEAGKSPFVNIRITSTGNAVIQCWDPGWDDDKPAAEHVIRQAELRKQADPAKWLADHFVKSVLHYLD
jgi:hypothetical protein